MLGASLWCENTLPIVNNLEAIYFPLMTHQASKRCRTPLVAWVTPWERKCGIADYSKVLWTEVERAYREKGMELVKVEQDPLDQLLGKLQELKPSVVFFQHEYGLWGGKNPPFYTFPRFVRQLKQVLPEVKIGATAHTVLPTHYRFPTQGRGWQIPLRAGANVFFLNRLRRVWGADTWGELDWVVVHSRLQAQAVEDAGAKRVVVIPHFVPTLGVPGTVSRSEAHAWPYSEKRLLVFGFLTPEKGQDLAIQILSKLPSDYRLIIAGGVRRPGDRKYEQQCRELAHSLKLGSRIEWTGYVESRLVDSMYSRAHLVLIPFRETSGSGSLAQAFARGSAILATDLPLNQEITQRVPGCMEFFKAGDADDGAQKVQRIFEREENLISLKVAAREYAAFCSVPKVARIFAEETELP